MPVPKRNESRSHYVKRAIPVMMAEGLTQAQAVGKSEGMFTYARGGKTGPHKKKSRGK